MAAIVMRIALHVILALTRAPWRSRLGTSEGLLDASRETGVRPPWNLSLIHI